jgi:transcriptional regulator with PAS, ATPase and Fis domain
MRRLMAYHWPGNVRQLENAIERAVAFTVGRSQIDVGDLPTEIQQAQEPALTSSVTLPKTASISTPSWRTSSAS